MPFAQILDHAIVSWDRFLRGFGLANANEVLSALRESVWLGNPRLSISTRTIRSCGYGQQDQGSFSETQI